MTDQTTDPDEYNEPDFEDIEAEPGDALQEALESEPVAQAPASEYEPYDLVQARPSPRFDPVDENGNPDTQGRPRLVNEQGEILPEFDERQKEDFYGLTFIGALSKTFEWLGHKFTIRTITVDEALNVALLTKQYADTVGGALAYRTAVAAMAVQRVDNKDLPIPVGEDGDLAYAQGRFDYAKARWFQYTIDAIYNEYLELEARTREVVEAMGKASGQTALTTG